MIMREYQEPIVLTKQEHEKQDLQKWLADSHYWVREHQTYHCKWCGKLTTTALEGDAHLCMKNPEILKIKD